MCKFILLIATLVILFLILGCSTLGMPVPLSGGTFAAAMPTLPKISNWIVTMSILAIAISAVAMFNGSRTAISGIVGGAVALFLAITVQRYAAVLAFSGLVGAFGFLVWTVWVKYQAIKQAREITTYVLGKDDALIESDLQEIQNRLVKPRMGLKNAFSK